MLAAALRHSRQAVARAAQAARAAEVSRGLATCAVVAAEAAPVAGRRAAGASAAATACGFAAAATLVGANVALAAPADEKTVVTASGARVAVSGGAKAKGGHPLVVFVLGGPGAGKGTQCANIVRDYGFDHLSAGDLLRAHMKSGSPEGNMVADMIKNGQIVPSEVTVNLLIDAMKASGKDKFLIDGFPRNAENRDAWEREAGYDCEFVLFFDCPEEVMEKRLLGRNQGRTDDNIESIRKRFKTYVESSLPVIEHYRGKGKVHHVVADASPEDVYAKVKPAFDPLVKTTLLDSTKRLLDAIDSGDFSTYQQLCDAGMSCFEPEARGQLVEGLDFHQFYFMGKKQKAPATRSTIANAKVRLMGKSAVVTYNRLIQRRVALPAAPSPAEEQERAGGWGLFGGGGNASQAPRAGAAPSAAFALPPTEVYEETRVWEQRPGGAWQTVHLHRSRPS